MNTATRQAVVRHLRHSSSDVRLTPLYVDRRARRSSSTAAAAVAANAQQQPREPMPSETTAAAATAAYVSMFRSHVHRADCDRRVPARVRRVHLRHRHMASLVRAVRLAQRRLQSVAGHRFLRRRPIG